MTKAVELCHRT